MTTAWRWSSQTRTCSPAAVPFWRSPRWLVRPARCGRAPLSWFATTTWWSSTGLHRPTDGTADSTIPESAPAAGWSCIAAPTRPRARSSSTRWPPSPAPSSSWGRTIRRICSRQDLSGSPSSLLIPTARTVRFSLARRAALPVPSGTTYGGVDVGGGGLVWTPGWGFVRVPPHSPLVDVLKAVVRIQELQESMSIASRDEVEALRQKPRRPCAASRGLSPARASKPPSHRSRGRSRPSRGLVTSAERRGRRSNGPASWPR